MPEILENMLLSIESNAASLTQLASRFQPSDRLRRLPGETFSFTGHMCHLRDLEEQGFTGIIQSIITQPDPLLHTFDGTAAAESSNYEAQDADKALAAFLRARAANIQVLRTLKPDAFDRVGHFEGAPAVALREIVEENMSEHDRQHIARLSAMLEAFA